MRGLEQIVLYFYNQNRLTDGEIADCRELGLLPELDSSCSDESSYDCVEVVDDDLDELFEKLVLDAHNDRMGRGRAVTHRKSRRQRRAERRNRIRRLPSMTPDHSGTSPLIALARRFAPCHTTREAIEILLRKPLDVLEQAMGLR